MLATEPQAEPQVVVAPQPALEPSRLWEWVALTFVLVLAAGLRMFRLDQNGFGNPYYAAAARSMLTSGVRFFFGSFDPAGVVTVDKPPVALWIQAASAWLFGYRGWSLMFPQAVMGVMSVGVTYWLVRRVFGTSPALLAGLITAVTPISVAIDRDNMPDTPLVLVLLLAAWALTRAVETGRLAPLLLSTALVGLGFNIKMLAAYLVLPTFYGVYLLTDTHDWRSKLRNLAAASVVLVVVSFSWCVAVELTPSDQRPYIGGSTRNSAFDLALGYNGLGRVFGGSNNFRPGGPPPGGAMTRPDGPAPASDAPAPPRASEDEAFPPPPGPDADAPPGFGGGPPPFPPGPGGPGRPGGPGGFGGGMGPMFGGHPGLLRFAYPMMAGQISWFFPLVIMGAAAVLVELGRPRPFTNRHLALYLWGGWFVTHWFVFSFAQGIFHEYYTTVMGPAVAALTAVGLGALWRAWRSGERLHRWLPVALAATALWQAYIIALVPGVRLGLLPITLGGTLAALVGLAHWGRDVPVVSRRLLAGGLLAILAGPVLWSVSCVVAPGISVMPAANPRALARPGGGGMPPMPFEVRQGAARKLIAFLQEHRDGAEFLVASPSAMEVGPIIIESGETAISFGGFLGADPVFTRDEFVKLVETGRLRYVLLGGGPGGGPPGRRGGPGGPPTGDANKEILQWIRSHGKVVDPNLWQEPIDENEPEPQPAPAADGGSMMGPPPGMLRRMRRERKLYDLRPEPSETVDQRAANDVHEPRI